MRTDIILEEKDKSASLRLDDSTALRLKEIRMARGLSKTDAIKYCIHNIPILQIGDVTNLAMEFYKIRIALENNCITEEIRKEVKGLCLCMSDLLARVETLEK